jgi:hypothetical protein
MIRKLLIISGIALMAFTGLTTLSSCEKDTANPKDKLTFAELNAPYTAPLGSVTFYARSSIMNSAGNAIDIYVDGSKVGTIIQPTPASGIPNCGTTGNVTTTLTTGVSHTWQAAKSGNFPGNSRSINLTSTVCAKQEVTSF